jgi:hypothetical protein
VVDDAGFDQEKWVCRQFLEEFVHIDVVVVVVYDDQLVDRCVQEVVAARAKICMQRDEPKTGDDGPSLKIHECGSKGMSTTSKLAQCQ